MNVVKHQHKRTLAATQRVAQPRYDHLVEIRSRAAKRRQNALFERLDFIEGGGD